MDKLRGMFKINSNYKFILVEFSATSDPSYVSKDTFWKLQISLAGVVFKLLIMLTFIFSQD